MSTRILTIGLSALLVLAAGAAWGQTTAPSNAAVWHGDTALGFVTGSW